MIPRGRGGAKNNWFCKDCIQKFTKINDQLMECEYCENHFCSVCVSAICLILNINIIFIHLECGFIVVANQKLKKPSKLRRKLKNVAKNILRNTAKKIEQIEKTLHSKMGTEVIEQKLSNFFRKWRNRTIN